MRMNGTREAAEKPVGIPSHGFFLLRRLLGRFSFGSAPCAAPARTFAMDDPEAPLKLLRGLLEDQPRMRGLCDQQVQVIRGNVSSGCGPRRV